MVLFSSECYKQLMADKDKPMKDEYVKILARAKKNKDLNKKFVIALSKKKVPKLDRIVQAIHAEVFPGIDCLQCGSCCRSLGPLFTTPDIVRISSHLRMKESAFVKEYLIVDEDEDFIFRSMPCPFLEDDDQCRIYDKRPRACVQYPHTDEKNIKLHKLAENALHCPAALLILEKLKEQFPSMVK
jgi:hypothetical protein